MNNKVSRDNADHKYFVITPRLVWVLCNSPFEYTLWNVIKDIAGDGGECIISTPDLAVLSMMSTGKVSECRTTLIELGLLSGELRKDPGYPQPVWHLTIPDIWEKNIAWSIAFPKISDRVEYKSNQKELSPHERLLGVELSCGERGTSPHETKKKDEEKEIFLTCFACHGLFAETDMSVFEYQNQLVHRCGNCEILGIVEPNQKRIGKSEVSGRIDAAIVNGASQQSSMVERVRISLRLNVDSKKKAHTDFVQFLKDRDAVGETVEKFASYWSTTWQGEKGQVPTIDQVTTQWPAAFAKQQQNKQTTFSNQPNRRLPTGV